MAWYEYRPQRLDSEIKLLKKYYSGPTTKYFIENGLFIIVHKVKGRFHTYIAKSVYPDNFPYEQIDTYIKKPRIRNLGETIHMFCNKNLCLARPEQIGPQTSGKIIIDWLRDWIRGYEIYLDTGKFPDRL